MSYGTFSRDSSSVSSANLSPRSPIRGAPSASPQPSEQSSLIRGGDVDRTADRLAASKELLQHAMDEAINPEKRHTAMYGFLAFLTLILMVKDYIVLEQGIEEDKNKAGQVMMISLASMNFVFFMLMGALGANNVLVNHVWIQRMFGLTSATYILLWCLQSSWTKDGVKWGKDMTNLGKANFYMTLFFVLPYIPVIYGAIVGQGTTTFGRKAGVFGIVLLIIIVLIAVIAAMNE